MNDHYPIYLNLYDISNSNKYLHHFGFGAYHSAIEIIGREYSFSNNGVVAGIPRTDIQGATFREQLFLGNFQGNLNAIHGIIAQLREEFPGISYHVIHKNCNHFSNAACQQLLGHSIPNWINRSASWGSWFVPKKEQPIDNTQQVQETPKDSTSTRPKLTEKQRQLLAQVKTPNTH